MKATESHLTELKKVYHEAVAYDGKIEPVMRRFWMKAGVSRATAYRWLEKVKAC